MRKTSFLLGMALCAGAVCWGAQIDKAAPPPAAKANAPATARDEAKPTRAAPGESATASSSTEKESTEKHSADEEAIRRTKETFAKAYELEDAKMAAAHFTPDAEYVDEQGNTFQGRQSIENSLAKFFTECPGCKLELNIDSIRFVSPGVAVEDGSATMIQADGETLAQSHYTTVHVKVDGKWLVASVRDQKPEDRPTHSAQLQQLEWLVGDWVDEGDQSIINFTCQPSENGNFLLRDFTIHMGGQAVMTGTQRIGWDPLSRKLRTWVFDSEGGYADGYWHRDGDKWVLKLTGVTADGETASSTSIYTYVNAHTMTWQAVDHEVDGVQMPDSQVVTIVRQAPAPQVAREDK